jgi:hypothetical protein
MVQGKANIFNKCPHFVQGKLLLLTCKAIYYFVIYVHVCVNREDRLVRLYRVLGLSEEEMFEEDGEIIDPDDTYELTTDNVKKILAIYMRFR